MNIVVIGGRGLVGRNVVERLRSQGYRVSAASRSTGVDLISGRGLAESLVGADVVVDVSNSPTFDDMAAFEFFKTATFNLLDAEKHAGVKHHVSLSVVGTGRLEASPYLHGKALQERLIASSGIPFTIVHATQFYEFLLDIITYAVGGQTIHLSPAYIEPVASDDVAATIARVAAKAPLNGSIEIAGPERGRMSELIQRFVRDMEAPYEVRTDVRAPYFGAMLDEFVLLPRKDAERGELGFQAWFEQSEYARADW
ncbi:NAD-dependent epimerase/dehydratase family protein [Rhodanobacter glycinis]|uniref:NAD-dependent epimerase/dehydratase family protein n=1 Tax=Rhodanobacter glycinis TaxID=582702 RepID=A0A502FDN9_9GAMM|nr:NAD(P)H-binding protein [Rhodanobacter glycinis]TPG11623.1 NAD-dependent epimerase/dehydratase family protein [Rhodanobacter glycinis]TPG47525.1 NAD-dependent epimerase/dehydratase family protein [Rhodanobacter glycinis]